MNNSSYGVGGIIGILLSIGLFLLLKNFFPAFSTLVLVAAGILLALALVIIVLVIIFSRKTDEDKANEAAAAQLAKVLSKGRAELMDMRRTLMKIKNKEVSGIGEEVCKIIDKILKTIREQPDNIPKIRQVFSYYMPTMKKILSKYSSLEESGLPAEEMSQGVIKSLEDIKTAMAKLHENLFEDHALDLTVEMEALKENCKRDGLLEEEDFLVNDVEEDEIIIAADEPIQTSAGEEGTEEAEAKELEVAPEEEQEEGETEKAEKEEAEKETAEEADEEEITLTL